RVRARAEAARAQPDSAADADGAQRGIRRRARASARRRRLLEQAVQPEDPDRARQGAAAARRRGCDRRRRRRRAVARRVRAAAAWPQARAGAADAARGAVPAAFVRACGPNGLYGSTFDSRLGQPRRRQSPAAEAARAPPAPEDRGRSGRPAARAQRAECRLFVGSRHSAGARARHAALSFIRHPEFRRGFNETVAPSLGIAAWGLVTGVAMVKSGLSLPVAVLMTMLVYAGSAQLAALPLIVA